MADAHSDQLPPDPLPYDPVGTLRTDGTKLIRIVADRAALDGLGDPVPSCPGWTLGDLARHMGSVWWSWLTRVQEGVVSEDDARSMPRPTAPAEDDDVIGWMTTGHGGLLSTLVDTPTDQLVWTFTGAPRDMNWLRRRMVQETAIHRWDAAETAGLPYGIPAAVAADGIDEYLMWFAGRRRDAEAAAAAGTSEPLDVTVHLHCTDPDLAEGSEGRGPAGGEWLVTRLENGHCEFVREHAKGDAAVRGRAHDLLLWCWRRPAGPVEILGDDAVAERFRAFADIG